jgi:hypothetical protein
MIIFPGANYQLPIRQASRMGHGPNGLAVCSRTSARTGIAVRTSTIEPGRMPEERTATMSHRGGYNRINVTS